MRYAKGWHMFDTIQHIGYLVDDLEKAVAWVRNGFGAERAGWTIHPRGVCSANCEIRNRKLITHWILVSRFDHVVPISAVEIGGI